MPSPDAATIQYKTEVTSNTKRVTKRSYLTTLKITVTVLPDGEPHTLKRMAFTTETADVGKQIAI